MRPQNKLGTILSAVMLILNVFSRTALGQQDAGKPQTADDVLRINTELVQTGVSVFDKQGRFVDGLKKEDFELRVDDRPVSISFFENIVAGSQRDRLARATGENEPMAVKGPSSAPSFRQRTIVFFLDDRHLSLDSVGRTRKTLLDFINKEMGENDLVAIASASGRIGFLQQFTDNKDVLRAAVGRIGHVPYIVSDYGRNPGSPMTEYMALSIERRDDSNVIEFYVQDCMKWAPRGVTRQERGATRRQCEVQIANRARQILLQAGTVTSGTYYSLETLLRSAARMPGSKLAFFISDGFLADTGPRGPTASDQLGRITDEARRAGVVIYTIDARGLASGALDATGNVPFDPNGGLENPSSSNDGVRNASTIIYNYRSPLKPGIYQVRVVARDDRSGILGSAMQWTVIPDLSTRQLSLSSLIVGIEGVTNKSAEAGQVQGSVDKKFAPGSHLRFMTFIYNAAQPVGASIELAAQVQVYRDGQAVISTPLKKVAAGTETTPARVPYTGEISLGALPPGRYILQVTVEDRAAQKTVSQQTAFYVQ